MKRTSAQILMVAVCLSIICLASIHSLKSKEAKENIMDDKSLVEANTKFGFKLYHEILKKDSGKNSFISPYSISVALSMTYNGANEATKEAMRKTLEYHEFSLEEINAMNESLSSKLNRGDPKVKLRIANSLWARKGIIFDMYFMQRNQKYYKANVTTLDFMDPEAPDEINNWVKKSTENKIDKIIQEIDPEAILYLLNAIYFKGSWTSEFDEKLTVDKPFHLMDGSVIEHPMMSQKGDFEYLENDKFQAIMLPYGEYKRISMFIFLPSPNSSLSSFMEELDAENWEKWINKFRQMEVTIVMPRFEMEYEVNLNEVLKALGMAVAFNSGSADFTAMVKSCPMGNVFIKEVKHKTFVKVNEEGTEAAAVTMVMMAAEAEKPSARMVVDRPFFFAIRDGQTGTILFMGTVVKPEE